MSKYPVSVNVGTYNPKWEKLKATLLSVVQQQGVKFQVIVSDDGSEYDCFDKVEEFFSRVGFADYVLVKGEHNEGIVSQVYHGLQSTDADYVKPLSPGDLLYDTHTLAKCYEHALAEQADVSFGDAIFYNRRNGKIQIIKHPHNPFEMAVYKGEKSYYDLVLNYVLLGDGISGAAILARKDILQQYLSLLLGRVIYAEDFFLRLAVLDGKNIVYYPHPVIWYEFADGGISTSGSDKWAKRLQKDDLAMDEICQENWRTDDERIANLVRNAMEHKKRATYPLGAKIDKYLHNPRMIYWRIHRKFFGAYSPTDVDESFIEKCFHA